MFFFFQAEDGIRDYKVTGVQTCALPISRNCGRCLRHCAPPTRRAAGCRAAVARRWPVGSRPCGYVSTDLRKCQLTLPFEYPIRTVRPFTVAATRAMLAAHH